MKVTRIDRKYTRKKYRIVQKITFRSNCAVRCTEPVMSEIVKEYFTSYSSADGYKKLSKDILESERSRLGKIGTLVYSCPSHADISPNLSASHGHSDRQMSVSEKHLSSNLFFQSGHIL